MQEMQEDYDMNEQMQPSLNLGQQQSSEMQPDQNLLDQLNEYLNSENKEQLFQNISQDNLIHLLKMAEQLQGQPSGPNMQNQLLSNLAGSSQNSSGAVNQMNLESLMQQIVAAQEAQNQNKEDSQNGSKEH